MNIFKSFLVVGVAFFVGILISSNVFAEQGNSLQSSSDPYSGYVIRSTGQFTEIDYIITDSDIRQNQSSGICTSGDFTVSSIFGGPGMDTAIFIGRTEILNIEPTATINWIFEIDDNHLNNIPGLPSDEQLAARFGDDFTLINDPNDDNLVFIPVPALKAEDSHEILCQTFDVSGTPRYLIKGMNTENLVFMIDVEFVKFADTPMLLTREIQGRSYVRIEAN